MFPINWEFLPNSSFTNDQGQLDPELNEAGRQQAVVVMFCFSNRYAERDEYFFLRQNVMNIPNQSHYSSTDINISGQNSCN